MYKVVNMKINDFVVATKNSNFTTQLYNDKL